MRYQLNSLPTGVHTKPRFFNLDALLVLAVLVYFTAPVVQAIIQAI